MQSDPNSIWKKFDFFIRGRVKGMPSTFHYPNLKNHPEVDREKVIHETLAFLMSHDANFRLRQSLQDWHEFSNEIQTK